MQAITQAVEFHSGQCGGNIRICVSNQTVLQAINRVYINTHVVRCCVKTKWGSKKHPDTHVEQSSPRASNMCSQTTSQENWLNFLSQITPGKKAIAQILHTMWKTKWQKMSSCCQAKFWLPIPDCIGQGLEHLNSEELGTMIQISTGHNHLNYHESKVGNSKNDTCRFCNTEHEEFINLVCECTISHSKR